MKTTDHGREARSRANQRLRKLTIGTAVLGAVATGGLGWVAAVTYGGTTAGVTTAYATTTNAATTTTSGTTTTAPLVTAVNGHAHASTGGS